MSQWHFHFPGLHASCATESRTDSLHPVLQHSLEWAEQDTPVSWTKTSPGDFLQLGSKPFQTKKHPSAQEQRDTPLPKKPYQQWFCTHPPCPPRFLEIIGSQATGTEQSYSQVFLQCAALGHAQPCCDSAASHINEAGINLNFRRSSGPSCLWRTLGISPYTFQKPHLACYY